MFMGDLAHVIAAPLHLHSHKERLTREAMLLNIKTALQESDLDGSSYSRLD
jgi:hypothetical protein